MGWKWIPAFFITCTWSLGVTASIAANEIVLTPFVPVVLRLEANGTRHLVVASKSNANKDSNDELVKASDKEMENSFWILESHTQRIPILITIDNILKANESDSGLVLDSRPSNITLRNPSTSSDVHTMVVLRQHSRSSPIPGLCSKTNSDALVHSSFDYDKVTVVFGAAGNVNESCLESKSKLSYSVYHSFLEEQNLKAPYLINTLSDALGKGNLGSKVDNEFIRRQGDNQFAISFTYIDLPINSSSGSVPGVASIFSVVVTDTENNTSVTYASAITYACHLNEQDSNEAQRQGPQCGNPNNFITRILYVPLLASGIFLGFVGQRYFRSSIFVLGLVSGSLLSFVTLYSPQYSYFVTLLASIAAGSIFSLLWMLLWHWFKQSEFTVLLSTLTLGFFISSSILYLPFIHDPVLKSDFNFWLTLTAIAMIPSVALLAFSKSAHILSCAVVGAYLVVLPLDHYWGSSLKYIVVDVIRRATVPEFNQTVLNHPFQTHDIVLSWLLVALALAGLLTQLLRERHRTGVSNRRASRDRYERENAINEQRMPLLFDEETMTTMREAAVAAVNAAAAQAAVNASSNVNRTSNVGVVDEYNRGAVGDPSAPPMSPGRSIPSSTRSRSGTLSMVTVTPRRRDVVLPKDTDLMQRRSRDIFKPPSPDTEGLT